MNYKNNLKIFLVYHKNSSLYKSDVFEPIQVGAENSVEDLDMIKDNTGDNISELNPYYCELTAHYWVLKNYIPETNEEYIGFAHYRRLPDLLNISNFDSPSIYGIGYSDSIKLFDNISNCYSSVYLGDYDVILPCSCYMYAQTVNPILRDNETNYNLYNHFRIEHNSDLLDVLKDIIIEYAPEFIKSVNDVFGLEKAYFYNIFIMKKNIIEKFLSWEFDLLSKIGDKIGGWNNDKYHRMAGFIGEVLVNIWIKQYSDELRLGYVPVYMINFESDYIQRANEYHEKGLLNEEISELENLYNITSNKLYVALSIADLYAKVGNSQMYNQYVNIIETLAVSGEDFFELANICVKYESDSKISRYFEKAIELAPDNKIFAQSFLLYSEKLRDIDMIYRAWEHLNNHTLTNVEKDKYNSFINLYKKVKSLS